MPDPCVPTINIVYPPPRSRAPDPVLSQRHEDVMRELKLLNKKVAQIMSIVDEFRDELAALSSVKESVLAFIDQISDKLDAALADDAEVAEQRTNLAVLRAEFRNQRVALMQAVTAGTPAEGEPTPAPEPVPEPTPAPVEPPAEVPAEPAPSDEPPAEPQVAS